MEPTQGMGCRSVDWTKKWPWLEPQVLYMKDAWRFLSDLLDAKAKAEHEIYPIPHEHGTPNIPEHVAGGGIDDGRMQAQDFSDAPRGQGSHCINVAGLCVES